LSLADVTRLTLGDDILVADSSFAASVLPRRKIGTHKWDVGGLVVIAGAPGYTGAAVLTAMAAARCGAGIVSVAAAPGVAAAISFLVPEATILQLPSGDASAGMRRARELIGERLDRSRAVVVGPGLGQDEIADALLNALFGVGSSRTSIGFGPPTHQSSDPDQNQLVADGILRLVKRPMVIDADGINWLAKQQEWPEILRGHTAVLTPHVGEMARLLGATADDVVADPVRTARDAATKAGQVVVFKYGHAVATDGRRVIIAEDAPPSLATAGSGDVLSGTIGAFLAQGLDPLEAAGLALFIGPKAARRIEKTTGTLGLIANDLPLAMAEELAALEFSSE